MMTARPGYDGLACFMVKNNNVSEHGGQPGGKRDITTKFLKIQVDSASLAPLKYHNIVAQNLLH